MRLFLFTLLIWVVIDAKKGSAAAAGAKKDKDADSGKAALEAIEGCSDAMSKIKGDTMANRDAKQRYWDIGTGSLVGYIDNGLGMDRIARSVGKRTLDADSTIYERTFEKISPVAIVDGELERMDAERAKFDTERAEFDERWKDVDDVGDQSRWKAADLEDLEAREKKADIKIKKMKGMKKFCKMGMEMLGAAFGPLADVGLGFISDLIFGDPYQQQIDQLNGRIDKVMTCMGALVQKLDKKIEDNRKWITGLKNLVGDNIIHDAVNAVKKLQFESLNIKVCEDVRSVKKHPLLADTFVRCDVVSEKEKCSLMWVHECDLDMTGSGSKQMGKDIVNQLYETQSALSKLMEVTKVAIFDNKHSSALADSEGLLQNSKYIIKLLQSFNDAMVPYLIIARQRGYYLSRKFFQDHFQETSDYSFVKWYSDMSKKLLAIYTQTRTKFISKPGSKCMAPGSPDGEGKSEPLKLTIDLGDVSGRYTFLMDKCRAICLEKGWCVGVETQLSRNVKRFICKLVTSVDEMGYKLKNDINIWTMTKHFERGGRRRRAKRTTRVSGSSNGGSKQQFVYTRPAHIDRGHMGRRNLQDIPYPIKGVQMMDGKTDRYQVKERIPKPSPLPCDPVSRNNCETDIGPSCVGGNSGWKVETDCKKYTQQTNSYKTFPLDWTITALGTTFPGTLSCGSSNCIQAGNTLAREIEEFPPVNMVKFQDESGTECHIAPSIKRYRRQCNIPTDFLESLTSNDDVDSVLEAKKNARGELYVNYPWDFEHCQLLCEKYQDHVGKNCKGFAVNYNYNNPQTFACFIFTDNSKYTDSGCSTNKINNGVDDVWEYYRDTDETPLTKSTYFLNNAYDLAQSMFYVVMKDREQMINWGQIDNIFVNNGNEQVLCPATHYTRYSKIKSVTWGNKNMFNCWNLQDVNDIKNADPFCRIGCESMTGIRQKSCSFWTPIGNQKGSWAPCAGNSPGSLCMKYQTDYMTDNRAGWNTVMKTKKFCQAWPECIGYWKEDDTHYWAMNQRDLLTKNLMNQGQGAFVCSDQDTRRDPVEDRMVSSLVYKAVKGNVYAIERLEGRIDSIPDVSSIDPCVRNGGKGPCQDTCANDNGKYICSCTEPLVLNSDKLTCSCPSWMHLNPVDGTCDRYRLGGLGHTCGYGSSIIRSQSECNEAASELSLNLVGDSWTGSYDKIPSGCSIRPSDGKLHFETTASGVGKGRSDLKPICKNTEICGLKPSEKCEKHVDWAFKYGQTDARAAKWYPSLLAISGKVKGKATRNDVHHTYYCDDVNRECSDISPACDANNKALSCPTCTWHETDVGYSDLKRLSDISLNDCKAKCDAENDCHGITIYASEKSSRTLTKCWLEKSTVNPSDAPGSSYITYVKSCSATSEEQVMDSFAFEDELLNRLVGLEQEISERMDMEDEDLLAEILSEI